MATTSGTGLCGALRLMVIIDPRLCRGRTPDEVAHLALRGGATALQLRDKGSDDALVLEAARRIAAQARGAGALFIVNDRVDVARLAGADGCHLGPADLPLAEARRLWPSPAVLGFSAGLPAEARDAASRGADYLGVGPVFPTRSKEDAGDAIGVSGVSAVVAATDLPVVAIGGVDARRVEECIAAGACGVAVIAAVAGAASVAPAARELRRAVDTALRARGGSPP